MLTRFAEWQGPEPVSVAADTTYGNREFLQWLADRSIARRRGSRWRLDCSVPRFPINDRHDHQEYDKGGYGVLQSFDEECGGSNCAEHNDA